MSGKMSEDEIREMLQEVRPVAILMGDWPDGEVARTVVFEGEDGRTTAVDWHRDVMGDGDEEWPGQPYEVRQVETEKVVTCRSWVPVDAA